jgi:tetratricopeptide (TPR) repeat protein
VHPEFALVLASRALKYMPDNKYLISKTVKLLLNMHYGKQALPYLDKHIKYFNEDFKEIKYVADLLYNEGLFEQARTYYNRAAELKHEDTDVQSNLVVCLWKEGMKDQALEKMNNLVVNNKENIMILFNGVYVMLAMGEKEASMTYLAKLKYLAPANPKVQLIMGMVAEMDGNLPAAITMYDLSFKGNPKDLATSLALCNALTKQKLWSRAIRQYQQSLEYFPNEPFILEKLGTLLVSCSDSTLRNMDEGMKLSERAFIHKASSPNITIAAGRSIAIAYAARGDYRTAYDYIEWVLDVARNQKVTAEYVKGLENLLMQYNTEKKKNTSGNK